MKNAFGVIAITTSIFLTSGCMSGKYKPVDNVVDLSVTFSNQEWDGTSIPNGQQCSRFDGDGSTPELIVNNIPKLSNALVFEYSDSDYQPMDNGGHGVIMYKLPEDKNSVSVPSVKGHTFDLPKGFKSITAHQAPNWDTAGAYMPPCSGGKGNSYYVTIKAVLDAPEGQQSKLLGETVLQLGRY